MNTDNRLILVSNRLPDPNATMAGGLAVGLTEALGNNKSHWFGWSGHISTNLKKSHVFSGPFQYHSIDLTQELYEGFYKGFSNSTLWPTLHWRTGLSRFKQGDFDIYQKANSLYAHHLHQLAKPNDIIWVHDYHLITLGQHLRELGLNNRLGFFLHTPFPPPAFFLALPSAKILAQALSSYSLIGVQTALDQTNMRNLFSQLNIKTPIEVCPIGIDATAFASLAKSNSTTVRALLPPRSTLVTSVDRLDYTKGLPQRVAAMEAFFQKFPNYRRHANFIQVCPLSRGDVEEYRALRARYEEAVARFNAEFSEFGWIPLNCMSRVMPRNYLAGLYRNSRIGLVSPLRDGMNLVAKEYIAAQNPSDPGVLILSKFAGAANQLTDALIVNPLDADEVARAINQAFLMSKNERKERWRNLYQNVSDHNAAAWARDFLRRLTCL